MGPRLGVGGLPAFFSTIQNLAAGSLRSEDRFTLCGSWELWGHRPGHDLPLWQISAGACSECDGWHSYVRRQVLLQFLVIVASFSSFNLVFGLAIGFKYEYVIGIGSA